MTQTNDLSYFMALADLLFPDGADSDMPGAKDPEAEYPPRGLPEGAAGEMPGANAKDLEVKYPPRGLPEGAAGEMPGANAKDLEVKYPPRGLPEGAAVTRLGPSPTGFIHLGNLFMAMVNQRLAEQSGGVFILRIEDTDRKREVEGAVPDLIRSLGYFGINFGEGVSLDALDDGGISQRGDYGPYFQSERRDIYRAFARKLVLEGKAYPCFMSEEELNGIRASQEAAKELPGVYGTYAKWRGADIGLVAEKIHGGEPYVVRFRADYEGAAGDATAAEAGETSGNGSVTGAGETAGNGGGVGCGSGGGGGAAGDAAAVEAGETITITDGIRGELTMPKNIMDVVILKQDGLPTYHFAHVVDDHLMRTTHVVRGEEWLSSLPVHIALSQALGFAPPTYCHTALLMKTENGVKRKLSKRKDPESALSYYIARGYHPLAMREYLMGLINSDYEEWRLSNPDVDSKAFTVTTEKMGASGMLFDLDKVQHVSRETLARIPAEELAEFMIDWAAREKRDALPVLLENKAALTAALDIGRGGDNPRKDLVYAEQIFDFLSYFFDPYFRMEDPLPDNIPEPEARELLRGYLAGYDYADDRERWFEKIRGLAVSHGYAAKPKDFKNDPERYKGHVGDVSMVIRRALTGRRNAPDIYEIEHILGEQRVRARYLQGCATT